MGRIGVQELLIVLVVALLIFGPSKLPEIGKSLGKGIRELRKASQDITKSIDDDGDKEGGA